MNNELRPVAPKWETCPHCESDLENGFCERCDRQIECPFPDCGCDGHRLCMAENGPNNASYAFNLEKLSAKRRKW